MHAGTCTNVPDQRRCSGGDVDRSQLGTAKREIVGCGVQNTGDGVKFKSSLESALAGLKANLQGVSDVASAKAALPQLEKGAAELDKLRELSVNLPADSKNALAALLASTRPALDGLFDKILAIPGVDSIAKPPIDALRAKLDALSKALPFRVRQETK